MPTTLNFSWETPTVGASTDTWGSIINTAFNAVDADLKIIQDSIPANLVLSTGGTFTGGIIAPTFTGNLVGDASGNAGTATALKTARSVSLNGPVTATGVLFDGTGNLTLTTAIADGTLTIAKTDGLQTALDEKVDAATITSGTAAPTGTPADGDIYLQYA